MSRSLAHSRRQSSRFPRVSGDEPGGWAYVTGADKFSPRERG